MPQKLSMKELTVAGAKIKVLEGGQGPDMLFLHGAEEPKRILPLIWTSLRRAIG